MQTTRYPTTAGEQANSSNVSFPTRSVSASQFEPAAPGGPAPSGVGAPGVPNAIPAAWATQGGAPGRPALGTFEIANENGVPPGAATPTPPATSSGELLEPAKIVGRVGDQVILAGDIEGTVNIILAVQLKDVPEEEKEKAAKQIENLQQQLFKQALKSEVNTKLGFIDFMRTVPPDKHAELQKRVKANFEKEFEDIRTKFANAETDEEKAELVARNMLLTRLAVLMQHHELDNLGQLDALLRTHGCSLEKQVRTYGEQKLQQMAVMRNIRQNVEITHEQMLDYYHEHLAEYAIPAKARWEQLSVRFDRFPNEAAAFAAISEMGNSVYLGGASFGAVAKKSSQDSNAEEGGMHDWTQKDSLASKPLDEAIFTVPTGKLSQIIRDDRGLHIVRVLERTDATHTSFVEAQVDIKDKIRMDRRNKDVQDYLDKVRANTTVWTIDDESPATPTP